MNKLYLHFWYDKKDHEVFTMEQVFDENSSLDDIKDSYKSLRGDFEYLYTKIIDMDSAEAVDMEELLELDRQKLIEQTDQD
jgi:hypothetical protein